MATLTNIRFHQELNDFLQPELRDRVISHELNLTRSVKDLIESIGIPHTEVDIIIIDGESVDFSYLVKGNEKIDVYPVAGSSGSQVIDISPLKHCQPEPLQPPCFVLDVHLGRLAAYLRMLGFDTLYRNDYSDSALASISADENRIVLSCDRQLLMRKKILRGYYVRQRQPKHQLLEILYRFDLTTKLKPFSRCIKCNGMTRTVEKREIEDKLLAKTKKYYNEFFQCGACKKIYWKGSHYLKMQAMIDELVLIQKDKLNSS